jgi:DNA-binding NtrC family response regulator
VGCVLVLEPDPEVRELIRLVVNRLGLDAVTEVPTPSVSIDIVVLEPESFRAFLTAQVLRERFPAVPIVCASIAPPGPKTSELRPFAYVQKPFVLDELQQALRRALSASKSDAA